MSLSFARGLSALLVLAAGCSSPSCAGSSSSVGERPVPADSAPVASSVTSAVPVDAAPPPVDLTLASRVDMIDKGAHGDACEERLRPVRRRVADAVDRVWPDIEAWGRALSPGAPYKRVRLGETYIRERAAPAKEPLGWKSRERSWDAVATTLGTLGPKVNEDWVALAREARGLLTFDLTRVVGGGWRDSTHASVGEPTVNKGRAVSRQGKSLTVLLDPEVFAGSEAQLAHYIEGIWTSKDLAVHVRWMRQGDEPNAYRFVLGSIPGEPSNVSEKRREIRLNPDVRAQAIAHEVGHVLGFGDRYAKKWDAARCLYVDELDPGDIMSEPEGTVTPLEWARLGAAYE